MPRPRTGEGRPLWGRAGYTTLHGARLSSVPSGDQSANPASVPAIATYHAPLGGLSVGKTLYLDVSSGGGQGAYAK